MGQPQNTAGAPVEAPPVTGAPLAQPSTMPPGSATPETDNLQKVGADPVVGMLRPLQIAPELKANIYKTYQGAKSQEDFIQAFRGLDAPPELKASLYKLRFQPPISDLQGAQQAIQQSHQQFNPIHPMGPEMQRQFAGAMEQPFPQWLQTGLERANTVAQAPHQMGQWLGNQMGNFAETMSSMQPQTPGSVTQERVPEQYRHAGSGAMRGAASLVGETAGDPTNWPFLAGAEARPLIQKALSMGFAVQMGHGTLQGVQDLYQNWDSLSPAERSEKITSTGLGAYFTKESAQHGFEGTLPIRERATQSGIRPGEREMQPQQPLATQKAPPTSKPQIGPLQPSGGASEGAPAAGGAVGTSTAGQTAARDVGGTTARARLTEALSKRQQAPGATNAPTPTIQPTPQAAAAPRPADAIQRPEPAQAPAGAARKPLPSTPAVGGLEARRSQQIESGRKQLIDRKVDPVVMGQKLGLVYDGFAGGVHSFRDTVKGGGVSVSDAAFSEAKLRENAEQHRASIKTEQLSPTVQDKQPRAAAELAQAQKPTPRTSDQAREIVARGEPRMPKGGDKVKMQEHAKARDEFLASKAQLAREDATKSVTQPQPKEHPLHQTLTRFLKTPGRTDEFYNALDAAKKENRPELAGEFEKRAAKADATVKHVREMQDVEDLDKYIREQLASPRVLGQKSSKVFEAKRFVPKPGAPTKEAFAPGGGTAKPKIVREHPQELTEFWNLIRGRTMQYVKGLDETGRGMKDLTVKHEDVRGGVKKAKADLDKVLRDIQAAGGKYTDEQQERATNALSLLTAATGKKQIAGKMGGVVEGASGEPRAQGTAQTQAWLNAVMGRPRTSHFAKPSPAELESRISYLERESKASKLVAEELGRKGEAKPVEAPKEAAKAPEKPVEAVKPAPKAPEAKKAPEPVREAPKPKEPIRKRTPDEETELRDLRDIKAGMAGEVTPQQMARVSDRIRELEGSSKPKEAPKSPAEKQLTVEEMDRRIKSLERSGKFPKTLERLKESYEKLTGKTRPASAEDILQKEQLEQAAKPRPKETLADRLKSEKTARTEPLEIRGEKIEQKEAGEKLAEYLERSQLEVPGLHDRVSQHAQDYIAHPIMEAIDRGELEAVDAQKRYARALDIYREGIKRKDTSALAKAIQYAKEGKLTPPKASEKGALSFGGLGKGSASFGKSVKDWYGRIKDSNARNREAKNLSDRLADLRQQSRHDVLIYGEISKHLKSDQPAAFYKDMYDWAEQKLLPAAQRTIQPTPEMQQRFKSEVEPIVEENSRIIQKLKGAGFNINNIAGLMHRVRMGKGQSVEKIIDRRMQVGSGNILSTYASSRRGAKYGVMTDPQTGQRHVVRVSKSGQVYVWDGGQQLGGSLGLRSEFENEGFKFGRGTTSEISRATGRDYYKHAWINNAIENLQLRRAERIHDFVENLKKEPEFKRMSTSSREVADALGFRRAKVTNAEWLPQFKGYYFEPHVAEVLEREWSKFQKGDFSAYERASNWLKHSIFWNPLIHTPNIGVHWLGEKGLSGQARMLFRPSEYKALSKAWNTMRNPVEYSKMLEAGVPLMRQPNTHDVTKLFLAKAFDQLPNSKQGSALAKAWGYANPVALAKALFRMSSEITWGTHDLAILQSTFARMEQHGWDLETASKEVTKHIPNYRMPPRVWNSRLIGRVMDAPGLSMFSQYHYGAFRSYGEMVKELVKPMKEGDRQRAIDRMLALGFMTYVLYPQLDKLAQSLTGDKDARLRRAGSSTFFYNLEKVARGTGVLKSKGPQMGVLPFAESVVTPAPIVGAGIKAAQSRELTRPGQKPAAVAKKALQVAGETVGAISGYESGQKTPGKGRFDWKTFLFKMAGGRFERSAAQGGLGGLKGLPKIK